ncbi:MAG: hypothetical protein ACFFD5_14470 [Candidatus Thorarchaeota archaeon]
MRRKTIIRLLIILFLFLNFIGISSTIKISYAQESGKSIIFNNYFPMYEFGEIIDTQENITSINLPLPDSTWNVTNININFTNIRLESEVVNGEDVIPDEQTFGHIYYNTPSKRRYGLGVQVNLTEPTIIYGVYIYGYKTQATTEAIQVEIRGYDDISNKPNSTIYHTQELNISDSVIWHIQNFSTPVSLPKGQFYLVLNGLGISSSSSDFYWAYNGVNPTNPSLYTSEYINSWSSGAQNRPYLYKLIQKVDRIYYPEDINMSLGLNGDFYNVSNTSIIGEGNLTANDLNFSSNSTVLNIPVYNDLSIRLNYSMSYNVTAYNIFNNQASVKVEEGQGCQWDIIPEIIRSTSVYSLKFYYPQNWYNLILERDGIDISSQVEINQTFHYLFIPNDVITETNNWRILANSLNCEINLNVPLTHYEVGQQLRIYLSGTVIPGIYTFQLFDPYGLHLEYNISKIIPPDDNLFSYDIPTNIIKGDYTAYLYFFNGTHAGVKTQIFKITIPFTINPVFLIFIFVLAGSIIAISTISFTSIKKLKKKRELHRKTIYDQCNDLLNIQYIMISDKKSALNIYEQSFIGKVLDTTLISGFLEAIRTFGIELTDSDDQTQTIKLEYKKSKILMAEFKHFRIILIMNDSPSHMFLDSIRALAIEIGEKYDKYLENFKGDVRPFKDLELLIKKNLKTSFLYPLKILKTGTIKITPLEKEIIQKAEKLIKRNGSQYFYVSKLFKENQFDSKEIETIFNLIDKKIFEPVF